MKRILTWLVFVIFLTSSFDIFFNLNLGGFNIRTCYLAAFGFIFLYINQYKDARKISFIGSLYFVIWSAFVVVFFYNSQFITRNVGYVAWLIFNILVCYSLFKISDKISLKYFLRLYIISFGLIALAGILQFLLSSVGIHILVSSWWKFNKFPRVNGFSYEPSYFASYLLIGFVFVYHLTKNQVYLFRKNVQTGLVLLISTAIFLSTSRMGILFLILIFLYDLVIMFFKSLWTLRISRVNLVIAFVFIFGFLGTIINIFNDDELRTRYLGGTGIESTAAHSRDARIVQMTNVYNVFIDSPFEGYSLGGIAPAIAAYMGDKIPDQKKAKEYEGLNIFLEVLAATGVFGFIFFVIWQFRLFQTNISLSSSLKSAGFSNESIVLDALKWALVTEFLILILSQNILRPYLWILIGLMNAVYFRLKPLIFHAEERLEYNTENRIQSG